MSSYHEVLEKAPRKVTQDSSLESEEVYYECRKPPSPKQKFNDDTKKVYYKGKLNSGHAECVGVSPISSYALVGKIIGFQCDDKPTDSKLFQFTDMHKGSCGTLKSNVFCIIVSQFQNIPNR
ncbi:MAG: hypothetical protein V1701_08265 [Planctomycetota bacterium]